MGMTMTVLKFVPTQMVASHVVVILAFYKLATRAMVIYEHIFI
jgi:hypothetical protein